MRRSEDWFMRYLDRILALNKKSLVERLKKDMPLPEIRIALLNLEKSTRKRKEIIEVLENA